ncbi:aminoacyl-tRNA hydrolase [Candidatus Sumerlaeota bacterium]|nr:aminoacyl-tRNA hydrolase [Candidatus Sumerlaeota bacterium]
MIKKWLIAGLGNPGKRYEGTPHNVGFDVVSKLAQRWNAPLTPSRQVLALTGCCSLNGSPIHLMQPTTYMNLSGTAIAPFMKRQNIPLDGLIVVYDDIDLPLGSLRLRESGSHGGHKGMLSIINTFGAREIKRIRIGVRPTGPVADTADYVLAKLPPNERIELVDAVDRAVQAVEKAVEADFQAAMNAFNQNARDSKD